MEALFVLLVIVAVWDCTKAAIKHTAADYQRSAKAAGKAAAAKAFPAKLSPGQKRAAMWRHRAGYWAGEVFHGFPVTRTGWHAGWLAHRTASERQKARREEARTSSLEQRASFLGALREHRRRQEEARKAIERATAEAPEPVRGKREVQKAAANVLPFPPRNPDGAPSQPSGSPQPEPGPYANQPAPGRQDDGAPGRRLEVVKPGSMEMVSDERGSWLRLRDWEFRDPTLAGDDDVSLDNDGMKDALAGYTIPELHDMAHGPDCTCPLSRARFTPDDWPANVPHRRKGDAPAPATTGGNAVMTADTTYTSVLADAKAAHAQADEDTSTIQKRMDDAYARADEMTAANVDPAVIDEQMAYADSLKDAIRALTDAGEHAGNTAATAERYHGGMQAAVDDAPGKVAERSFHEGS